MQRAVCSALLNRRDRCDGADQELGMYHVRRAGQITLEPPALYAGHARGHRRCALVGRHVGAVHTGFDLCALDAGGTVGEHLHSFEQSFYVLEGAPRIELDGHAWELAPGECGLVPVGVPHAMHAAGGADCRWLEVSAPAPRDGGGPPDTFFTGRAADVAAAPRADVRDPRTRALFRLDDGQMDVDNLKTGARVDAPTVSASMATALLAYSGITLKMLVDSRLGAYLHTMFMVEYQPGGNALPHDHPLEETYFIMDGEVEAEADGERFTLHAGDVFWTGVGCIHAFYNTSDGRVRFLETQSPQLPANHSYRFNRDWDYVAERLEAERG
jgi:quercetin dioxygenase-like cupin family protein